MNQFRQSLEDLFKEAEMKQKIKDLEEYYNREVEDLRNNSIMNKLNELMGIRSAYANDTVPYVPTDYSKYGAGFTREEIDQMNNDKSIILSSQILSNTISELFGISSRIL